MMKTQNVTYKLYRRGNRFDDTTIVAKFYEELSL